MELPPILRVTLQVLIMKIILIALLVLCGVVFKGYVYDPEISPYVSKFIGPSDKQVRKVIEHFVGMNIALRSVAIPKRYPACESNSQAQFLFKTQAIRLASDCSVEINETYWSAVEGEKEFKIYPIKPIYEDLTFEIRPSGADYSIKFTLPVKNSAYSSIFGEKQDLIVAYTGEMTLKYVGRDLLSHWLPLGSPITVKEIYRP